MTAVFHIHPTALFPTSRSMSEGPVPRLAGHARLRSSIVIVENALELQVRTLERDASRSSEENTRRLSVRALERCARRLSEALSLEAELDSLGEAVTLAPRYYRRAQALREEHEIFTRDLARIHADSIHARGLGDWRQLVCRFQRLGARLARHEAAENEIVTRALLEDLGAGD